MQFTKDLANAFETCLLSGKAPWQVYNISDACCTIRRLPAESSLNWNCARRAIVMLSVEPFQSTFTSSIRTSTIMRLSSTNCRRKQSKFYKAVLCCLWQGRALASA